MFIAVAWLAGALAALWFIVRLADALVRLALRRRGGPGILVQLWALCLLPGALLRLLTRLLTAKLLRVRVTEAGLSLPRALSPTGMLAIDHLDIEPTDVLRESIIEMVPAVAANLATLGAALLAGYPLRPDSDSVFLRHVPHVIAAAWTTPVQALLATYLMIALTTARHCRGRWGGARGSFR